MSNRSKRTAVPKRESRGYLAKAERFLDAAGAVEGNHDAVMLNAIHAGISAADAVCVAEAGLRHSGEDHFGAADLLEEVSSDGTVRTQANRLRRLISQKHLVEYEAQGATSAGPGRHFDAPSIWSAGRANRSSVHGSDRSVEI
jgi:hypothetical protein